jgi:hypothetical protein
MDGTPGSIWKSPLRRRGGQPSIEQRLRRRWRPSSEGLGAGGRGSYRPCWSRAPGPWARRWPCRLRPGGPWARRWTCRLSPYGPWARRWICRLRPGARPPPRRWTCWCRIDAGWPRPWICQSRPRVGWPRRWICRSRLGAWPPRRWICRSRPGLDAAWHSLSRSRPGGGWPRRWIRRSRRGGPPRRLACRWRPGVSWTGRRPGGRGACRDGGPAGGGPVGTVGPTGIGVSRAVDGFGAGPGSFRTAGAAAFARPLEGLAGRDGSGQPPTTGSHSPPWFWPGLRRRRRPPRRRRRFLPGRSSSLTWPLPWLPAALAPAPLSPCACSLLQ